MWDDTDNDVYKEKEEHSSAVTFYSQSITSLELTGWCHPQGDLTLQIVGNCMLTFPKALTGYSYWLL